MKASFRIGVLALAVWLGLSGVSFAKELFFRDGSVLECESFRERNGVVVVKVNRDVVLEFAPAELDLRKTVRHEKRKSSHAKRKRAHAAAKVPVAAETPAAPAPAVASTVEQNSAEPTAPTAATGTAAPPAPAPPSHAPVSAAPATQPGPEAAAAPAALSKEEYERLTKEHADMMAEAIKKGDPELMKKALEAQKELVRRHRESGKTAAVGPNGLKPEPPWFKYFLMLAASGVLVIVGLWGTFRKAGHSGIESIVPIYNYFVLMRISGKPGWWCLLVFVPVVGLATHLLAMLSLAEKFQRSALFAVGLVFLPMICFPLLAFGGSQYTEIREEVLEFTFADEVPEA